MTNTEKQQGTAKEQPTISGHAKTQFVNFIFEEESEEWNEDKEDEEDELLYDDII